MVWPVAEIARLIDEGDKIFGFVFVDSSSKRYLPRTRAAIAEDVQKGLADIEAAMEGKIRPAY